MSEPLAIIGDAEFAPLMTTEEFTAAKRQQIEHASRIQIVADPEGKELSNAVAVLRDIKRLVDATNDLEMAKRKPVNEWLKELRAFRDKLLADLIAEQARIGKLVDAYQRKQVEEKNRRDREAQAERDKAQREAQEAQRRIEAAQREAEAAKTKAQMEAAQSKLLDAQLAQEEAALSQQQAEATLAIPTNTPRGLVTKTRYDFEITQPQMFVATFWTQWCVWKAGEETLHIDRAGLLKALNNPESPTAKSLCPEDGQQSVQHACGIRVYSDTSTHVRS